MRPTHRGYQIMAGNEIQVNDRCYSRNDMVSGKRFGAEFSLASETKNKDVWGISQQSKVGRKCRCRKGRRALLQAMGRGFGDGGDIWMGSCRRPKCASAALEAFARLVWWRCVVVPYCGRV